LLIAGFVACAPSFRAFRTVDLRPSSTAIVT
jgi:hypothetical protein